MVKISCKIFMVFHYQNRQDNEDPAGGRGDIPRISHTKHLGQIMDFIVVTGNGYNPILFDYKTTINADRYCNRLLYKVLPWVKSTTQSATTCSSVTTQWHAWA